MSDHPNRQSASDDPRRKRARAHPTRRALIGGSAALVASMVLPTGVGAEVTEVATRRIPSTGEAVPAVGLGSWVTFNVGDDPVLRDESAAVMEAFFNAGGRAIDSSPMYGSSQAVIGYGLKKLGRPDGLFAADKVWTPTPAGGPADIEQSLQNWAIPAFDLLQVHNLVAWQAHLPLLFEMKAAGALRYVGITTSHGRRHEAVEEIMRSEPLDFVQLTYNPVDREAEERLLPLARDRGIGIVVNRPFRRGQLTRGLASVPLPEWAGEIGASSWAEFHLKFILSHPAVTVAIPATTRPAHAVENVTAAADLLPDDSLREKMAAFIRNL
jgi:aryl-alcohol dehydrogenase-like predicted oxidoreductase